MSTINSNRDHGDHYDQAQTREIAFTDPVCGMSTNNKDTFISYGHENITHISAANAVWGSSRTILKNIWWM